MESDPHAMGWWLECGLFLGDPEASLLPTDSEPVYGYQAVNVQMQKRSAHSLLSWMRRLIEVRKSTLVFGRGSIEFLYPANHRILAYIRQLGERDGPAVNNLSKSAQAVELDLSRHQGCIPIEMFGKNLFPRIGRVPYLLTMAPYQFFWFRLRRL